VITVFQPWAHQQEYFTEAHNPTKKASTEAAEILKTFQEFKSDPVNADRVDRGYAEYVARPFLSWSF
jgi:hypothetical protein